MGRGILPSHYQIKNNYKFKCKLRGRDFGLNLPKISLEIYSDWARIVQRRRGVNILFIFNFHKYNRVIPLSLLLNYNKSYPFKKKKFSKDRCWKDKWLKHDRCCLRIIFGRKTNTPYNLIIDISRFVKVTMSHNRPNSKIQQHCDFFVRTKNDRNNLGDTIV